MSGLEGKRILFIGIGFYDYDDHISKKIRELGGVVDYFKDYPKLNLFRYLMKKLLVGYEKKYIKKYYQDIADSVKEKAYDFIFVIKGENLPVWFIEDLRLSNNEACFILYQWDSIVRLKNFNNIKSTFNRVITFDRLDSINYGLEFRPLFFKDIYAKSSQSCDINNDVYFSGYMHSDRYEILNEFKKNYDIKLKMHLYIRLLELMKLVFLDLIKKWKFIDLKDISIKSINDIKNRKNMCESLAVIDIHHPDQVGLTIRTIETIAMGKKLITTNEDIKNYDFFDSNMIFILDRELKIFSKGFLMDSKNKTNQTFLINFSLEKWLSEIFINTENLK